MEATRSQGARSRTRMRAALNRRFPDHAAVVERLIEECERFRELCVDYMECGKVLRRFEQHGDTNRHPATQTTSVRGRMSTRICKRASRRSCSNVSRTERLARVVE